MTNVINNTSVPSLSTTYDPSSVLEAFHYVSLQRSVDATLDLSVPDREHPEALWPVVDGWYASACLQKTRGNVSVLFRSRASVYDAGPPLNQHWITLFCKPCLLRKHSDNLRCWLHSPVSTCAERHGALVL